jgi:sirohydrochlorin cobaltochelatase
MNGSAMSSVNPPFPPDSGSCSNGAAAKRGVLLFGHGARDPQWALPFEQIAARMRALEPEVEVQLGYLEFMQPDLPGAAQRLAERGCSEVSIVPLFLGAGGHVRRDVPPLVAGLAERHPGVRWRLQPAIGEIPAVIEALALASLTSGRTGGAKGEGGGGPDNPAAAHTPPPHTAR